MASWHQSKNTTALQMLWAPHESKWKCVSDKPGQSAGCISFDNEKDARAYCDRTGDVLIVPRAKMEN